ncbi:hypothetical protein B0H14DRAFT_2962100 [Mycena olivaceomarginata]|nr:hypothetical protein B0H14DRAFT_2962100 [Mycena olivaceomarginata]
MKHTRLFPQANQHPQRLSTPLRPHVCVPPYQTGTFPSRKSGTVTPIPPRNTRSKSMATAPCANRGGSARLCPPPIHRAFSWCAFLDLIALCHWNLCNYQAGTRTALPKTVVTLASAYTSLSVSFERHSRAPVLLAPPPNISGKNSEPSPLLRTTSALPLRWPPHPDTSSHSPQR